MEPTHTYLHCLVYISSATHEFSPEELNEILAKSRVNNSDLGVTGMLIYSAGNIIQVLEGKKDAINNLLSRIDRDGRHFGLIKLIDKPIENRSFGEWSMGFRAIKTKDAEGFKNISQSSEFFKDNTVTDEIIADILKDFVKNNS